MSFIDSLFNNYEKISKINYEFLQDIIKNNNNEYYIINTMDITVQNVLIPNTIHYMDEENIINELINNRDFNKKIIIYGKNNNDEKIINKYLQLKRYGFTNLFLYYGGLFEWLLLQDVYGKELFPTKGNTLDILKYKPLNINLKKN